MALPAGVLKGHAEDRAKIVSLNERVKVPLRRYRHTLMTLETSPLEPDVLEAKFYARGVGQVLAVGLSGGHGPRGADAGQAAEPREAEAAADAAAARARRRRTRP